MKKKFLRSILLVGFAVFTVSTAILAAHGVDTRITDQDRLYIAKILQEPEKAADGFTRPQNFSEEIDTILRIQNAIFDTAPDVKLIPLGYSREPEDLYTVKSGYCGDRARTLDKALRLYGFETRYASLYGKNPDKNFFQTLLSSGDIEAPSHALVEVKTSKGWMAVDTRTHWIALDQAELPHGMQSMQKSAALHFWPAWSSRSAEPPYKIFQQEFYILYGFYSRHGQFYAPYTPYIPDIDYKQFWINFVPDLGIS